MVQIQEFQKKKILDLEKSTLSITACRIKVLNIRKVFKFTLYNNYELLIKKILLYIWGYSRPPAVTSLPIERIFSRLFLRFHASFYTRHNRR